MIYSLILSILPLVQFVFSQNLYCEDNGAKEAQLNIRFDDFGSKRTYLAYCKNLDLENCPQHYPIPHERSSSKYCKYTGKYEFGDEKFYRIAYNCDSFNHWDSFFNMTQRNNWKCENLS